MRKPTLILFFLVSFITEAHELDSLLNRVNHTESEKSKIELWEKIINISIWHTSDSVMKNYIDTLSNYSQTRSNEYGIATANLLYSKYYERQQDLVKARGYASKAYKSFEDQKNKLGLCKVLRQQGFNALKKGDLELASELAYKALDTSVAIENMKQKALCLGQVAILNYATEPEEAIKLQKQSIRILMDIDAYREASSSIINLSTFYLNMYKDAESLEYLDTLFQLQKDLNDIVILAQGNLQAAISYNSLGMFQKSDEAMGKSEYYYMAINNPSKQAEFYRIKGGFYRDRGEYMKAIEASEKGLFLIQEMEGLNMENQWLNYNLYDSYKALGRYKEALEAFERTEEIKSKLYDEKTQETVSELKEKYESTQKEQELELMRQQERLSAIEIQEKEAKIRERTYLLVALGILLVSIIIWMYFRRRQKVLKYEMHSAQLEHKALRTQMNPHFIFNSLNSIQRMYVEGNTDEANDFLTEFSGLIRNILENSNHDKIALNEEISTLKSYLELEKLRTKDKFDFTIDIDESIDQYNYKVPPLVIQPFVENAIWHGILPGDRKGEIQVKLTKVGDRIHVEVRDNGVGFSAENTNKHESQGIKITEKRIGSKVNIESSTEGTKIDFTI